MKIRRYFLLNVFILFYTLLFTLYTVVYALGFKIIAAKPGIITPNDDHYNDILIVTYDNPSDSNISGKIISLSGYYVADMIDDISDPDNLKIIWYGKDAGGNVVPSGIYIYQIEAEGEVINGTVVVAK